MSNWLSDSFPLLTQADIKNIKRNGHIKELDERIQSRIETMLTTYRSDYSTLEDRLQAVLNQAAILSQLILEYQKVLNE